MTYLSIWVCEHDYFPTAYFYTIKGLYVTNKNNLNNSIVFKTNSKINKGLYFNNKFESYIDLIFNSRVDLIKLYQNVEWITQVIGENNENYYFETINSILLYSDYQCSGKIDIPNNLFKISRNVENKWQFNDFRDMIISKILPIIDKEGRINENNLNNLKSWFDKSNFISNFIVIRLYMNNIDNKTIYIHNVNVKSRLSDR